ncbi:MAG TPA: T9SS type A sorting domain-containing protein [Flavisolibacter sp.]
MHAEAYPIPHNGAFTIRVFSPEEGLATVELFTVGGQKLAEKRGMVRTGIATFFSFSGMPQGAFFYRVLVGSRQTNGKVLGAK